MKNITYKRSGVDINKADLLIEKAKNLINSTRIKGCVGSVGSFGGFFDMAKTGLKDPILVASTDGVGTKLKIAQLASKHDTIGIDLVAMCVNDVLCSGARPLFFLDYFATGKLEKGVWNKVIKSIVDGCKQAGCALIGGETAEMPGMYAAGEYDLAGFAVGVVEREKIITGDDITPGDVILGIASSGLHSNGFSMVRKLFTERELKRQSGLFLTPTIIYVKAFLDAARSARIKGAANITGGGFYDNIPRMLPEGRQAVIRKGTWVLPKVFTMIVDKTGEKDKELYRTFNMGIGMTLAVSKKDAGIVSKILLKRHGIKSWIIGEIVKGKRRAELI